MSSTYAYLPFQIGAGRPKEVLLAHCRSRDALLTYIEGIRDFTTAGIEYGKLVELCDVDLPESASGRYHDTRMMAVIKMRRPDYQLITTVVCAPSHEIFDEYLRVTTEAGQAITDLYAEMSGLELTFDEGRLCR